MYVEAAMMGLSAIQEIGSTNRNRREGRRQRTFLSDALKDLGLAEKSLQQSLGGSLALSTLESQRTLESLSDSGQKTIQQIGKRQDQINQATGFANVGMDDDMIKDVRKQFQTKREDVDIALTKSLSDVLSQFEQQKFEMKSQRQQLEMQKRMANEQANTKYFGIF
jgi:diacylglycerol kinase family enzyme|tara:strand:- start:1313 stop:1810 length:498 start_codon:yes stop_codon:yes gene_type:complete